MSALGTMFAQELRGDMFDDWRERFYDESEPDPFVTTCRNCMHCQLPDPKLGHEGIGWCEDGNQFVTTDDEVDCSDWC